MSQGLQYLKRGKEVQQTHRGRDNCPYANLKFLSFSAGGVSAQKSYSVDANSRKASKKWRCASKLSSSDRLLLHKSAGHLSVPNLSVDCDDCLVSKGGKLGHAKSSDPDRRAKQPLEQINIDFWGPIPRSRLENHFVVVIMCDVSALKVLLDVPCAI